MYYKRSSKTFRRPLMKRRRKSKRLPNLNQTRFFTPQNITTGVRYAVKGVNLMKSLINSELKRFDTSFSALPSSTASFNLLTATNQGDDVENRNGNSILAKYITWNYTLTMNASASATMVRFIVFVDGDNDQQTPTEAELLANSAIFTSAINPDYTSRFTILYDRIHSMSINGDRIITDKWYKPLNYHIKYITGTGSTGFGKGNIWLYSKSNEATNTPTHTGYVRLAFYDN